MVNGDPPLFSGSELNENVENRRSIFSCTLGELNLHFSFPNEVLTTRLQAIVGKYC